MTDRILIEKALRSLGKGFDLTSDFRLKFCRGDAPLVNLNRSETRDLHLPGILQSSSSAFHDISIDIKCDKGELIRHQSDILDFQKMSEWFNHRSSVSGKIPNGLFNAMFGFESGSWAADAANTNCLALDGYFIELFNLHIDRHPLVISDEVRKAVPSSWNPPELARFIEKYGTHIVVGLSIGGQSVVLVRQDRTSSMEPSELKMHLDDLADQLFTGACSLSPRRRKLTKVPQAFRVFDPQPSPFSNFSSTATKNGITVTCSKRGGDPSASSSHCEWLPTVSSMPDAINFNFIPIASLLKGVPGQGFLSHAINLYLRYKPPVGDLAYFLDFQAHRIWAPVHNDMPLGPTTNRTHRGPSLHINMMTPKLHVNSDQVTVGKSPVTGMRLFLEGMKFNRLAIHLQHLSNTSTLLQSKIQGFPLLWASSEKEPDNLYVEPIRSRQFSHVCTKPVKYDPAWNPDPDKHVAYIVTGAQLHVRKLDNGKSVLHLRLLYSEVAGSSVVQSNWAQCADGMSQRRSSGLISAISMSLTGGAFGLGEGSGQRGDNGGEPVVINSAVYPDGPPAKTRGHKLLRYVEVGEVCRGQQDSPGHWLVTGARLELEKGKICLHIKFSLLNYSSS
uniref:MACPF domain-containing protein n=1 Tax=Kalanchoe fedtschenkoi TaxID=63787 RepID=A0A7N0TG34_KALFE